MMKIVRGLVSRYSFTAFSKISTFATQKTKAVPDKSQQIVEAFTDKRIEETKDQHATAGRSWRANQLRLKSTEDLHKLWFVCVREKNLVLADEMAKDHDPTYKRKAGKIRRVEKLDQSMSRILHVINERQQIRKNFRSLLEEQYITKKKNQLAKSVSKQPKTPEITHQMLRAKYRDLRKGIDNTKYLEKMWEQKEKQVERAERADRRVQSLDPSKQFDSFWEHEMTIGEKPTQMEILKTHITNWKSLNLKQRKIILGFLNARRSKDAKNTFIKELKILGQKIAIQQAKERTSQPIE